MPEAAEGLSRVLAIDEAQFVHLHCIALRLQDGIMVCSSVLGTQEDSNWLQMWCSSFGAKRWAWLNNNSTHACQRA